MITSTVLLKTNKGFSIIIFLHVRVEPPEPLEQNWQKTRPEKYEKKKWLAHVSIDAALCPPMRATFDTNSRTRFKTVYLIHVTGKATVTRPREGTEPRDTEPRDTEPRDTETFAKHRNSL